MILDRLDTEILHMLKEDPRNVSAIARKLGMPVETVRYRLKRMLDNGLIRPFAIPNFPRLGLTALMAFLESKFWRDLEDFTRLTSLRDLYL